MKNYYNKYINSINKNIRNFDQTKALILEKKIKIVKKKKIKKLYFWAMEEAHLYLVIFL